MKNLISEFKDSLIISKDVIEEFTEIKIDSNLKDGFLKDLPIVKSITGVLKFSKNIYDRNLLKQTLYFICELNSGDINQDKLNEYRLSIDTDVKKCEKELGRILLLLNGFIDNEKSIMLARIYKAYIFSNINWDTFCEYSEIINRLLIQDVKMLYCLDKDTLLYYGNSDSIPHHCIDRIKSLGIIEDFRNSISGRQVREAREKNTFKHIIRDGYCMLNSYGKKFIDIIAGNDI